MLDYSLVAAVAAVVREGSFERAAQALHITPSAVSQRVKLLEERLGQVLVVRAQPCTATAAGHALCRHAAHVAVLETELVRHAPALAAVDAPLPTLRVAVNADSLATWFLPAMAAFTAAQPALLDLCIEDQAHTAEQLRAGEVMAAVTALAGPVQGCNSVPLGRQRYVAAASPAFARRWFAAGVHAQSLAVAPCLHFNHKDRLQDDWMQAVCGHPVAAPRHWIPASQAFVDAAVLGLGWGMQPASLVADALANGHLVHLLPAQPLWVPLHWQVPRSAAQSLARLTDAVVAAAGTALDPALCPMPAG